MSIDRFQLVSRHNPVLKELDLDSPLTVGNGEFAFTADVTGLQSVYKEYKENHVPLCTMSQWGWHTAPAGKHFEQDINSLKAPEVSTARETLYYKPEEVYLTEYDFAGRTVAYAVEKKAGNEEVYDWLRQNPHRLNLGRLAFCYEGKELKPGDLTDIRQELKLYEGILESSFCIKGKKCLVRTACHSKDAVLGVSIESEALAGGSLTVHLIFPYGSPDITASDFNRTGYHSSKILKQEQGSLLLLRTLDRDSYYAGLYGDEKLQFTQLNPHDFSVTGTGNHLDFTLAFSKEKGEMVYSTDTVFQNSRRAWKNFWEMGGIIELNKSRDPRAIELERRIILSQYLSAIQSCGSMPPQETGLTCNSWYGKFHLEMYLWHCAYLPLWNRTGLLERSLPWYRKNLEAARKNAAKNGYEGARWPKMVAYDAIDSPSMIATLLIWQQPHIIYMLELAYESGKDLSFLEEYWEVVRETADFMANYAIWNPVTGKYDLRSPIIPAQEEHDPKITVNPAFEVEYWRFALKLAANWARRLGKEAGSWQEVSECMAELPVKDGLYLAHENCPDTFTEFNRDHPSMLGAYGLIASDRISEEYMRNTLNKVLECWDFSTMWGWDFAMMAMTAVRLGDADTAIDILLKDTPKNSYVASGNNFQKLRTDLPLYLPGNGSLLLALPIMTAGYPGCREELPGFPKDGRWTVEYEGISPFPY